MWHLEHRTCEGRDPEYFRLLGSIQVLLILRVVIEAVFHHDRAAVGARTVDNIACALCSLQPAPEQRAAKVFCKRKCSAELFEEGSMRRKGMRHVVESKLQEENDCQTCCSGCQEQYP